MQQTIQQPTLMEIPLEQLWPSPENRRELDPQSPDNLELAESIKQSGVIQPILVRRAEPPFPKPYEIVAGHRRWFCSGLAGLARVPCIVREEDPQQAAEMRLVENLQREDMPPVAEARMLTQYMDRFEVSQREAARRLGISQAKISKRLAILRLPEGVWSLVDSGVITKPDAYALSQLAGQPDVVADIVRHRDRYPDPGDIEREVRSRLGKKSSPPPLKPMPTESPTPKPRRHVLPWHQREKVGVTVHFTGADYRRAVKVFGRYRLSEELSRVVNKHLEEVSSSR